MRVAVLGPGGVGGFVAAALARARHEVVVVAREQTVCQLGRDGLSLDSVSLGGSFSVRPEAAARLAEPVEALLVATKAGGLDAALRRIEAAPDLVVPLLNGVEHMTPLRARFGDAVVAGVIRIESDRPRTGVIVQTSPSARIDIAGSDPRAGALAGALRLAGIDVRTGDSEAQVLWSKLARLNALALTTTAGDRTLGEVRSDPRWRSALEGAVRETVAVAAAEGAVVSAAGTLTELAAAHPRLGSSMRRDVAAGRPPELDALAGAVLRAGARHGLRCPTVSWLAARVAERAGIDAPAA